MSRSILRSGMLLILTALGVPAAAQTELFFAAGVDSTGWAQARSNADGHVLIESPQYPRGLWLHLVDGAGDALADLQVEYQEQPDGVAAIRCVDPVGAVRETLVWTRPEGNALRLTLQPKEAGDLPTGLSRIDWQIDASVEVLLEPVEDTRLVGWEAVAAFLKARWQSQAGRVAVQFNARTLAIEVDRPEDVDTLVAYLQQTPQLADAAFGAINPLKMQMQVFAGNLGLQEGVILHIPLLSDPNLESVVREVLGRPRGRLTPEDVAYLTDLWAKSKGIRSLAGIEYFAALRWLELSDNRIVDLTPISQLKELSRLWLSGNQIDDDALTSISQLNLYELVLSGNRIVDLTPISQLEYLVHLDLGGNRIVDLTPISQLENLYALDLGSNRIVDLTPISQLDLGHLDLGGNRIVDLTPISQLEYLVHLDLGGNRIVDLTPISQLKALQRLDLGGNRIVDLTPISQLENLYALVLSDSRIVDLTPISQLKSLRGLWLSGSQIDDDALTPISQLKLRDLDLSGSRIVDLTPISQLKSLQRLFLSNNRIEDVSPLAKLTRLKHLKLSTNRIEDVSPLAKLTYLKHLELSTNRIEDVSPLAELTYLKHLHLMSNPLSDQALTEHIPAMKSRGVTVHY